MKHRTTTILSLCLLAFLVSTACLVSSVRGSGRVTSETRPVSGFDQITLSGVGTLYIIHGTTESLEIEAEDNLLEYIQTEVRGHTLEIRIDDEDMRTAIQPTEPIRYYLTVQELSRVEISGAGKVDIDGLEATSLEVLTSGAGDIEIKDLSASSLRIVLSGAGNCEIRDSAVTEQEIEISGAGNYDGADLESQEASITISGMGSATLWATETLDVEISGAGNVEYYGSPHVTQNISGAGRVNGLGER